SEIRNNRASLSRHGFPSRGRRRIRRRSLHVSRSRVDPVEASRVSRRCECNARSSVPACQPGSRYCVRNCRQRNRTPRQHDRGDQSRGATRREKMTRATIDKYISVFNIGLQNTFVYRWNYFLRGLFGLIPLAGTVFLWSAVFKERGGGLHGYDYSSMIYYYLLTILVSNLVVPTEDEWQIAADIREGQINALLTKPMSYLAYRFSIFLSGRLVYSF